MIRLATVNPAKPSVAEQRRRAMLAKVHIARQSLAMEDDDYRALLERVAGVTSAKDCTAPKLDKVLAEFERLGFRAKARPKRADHPVAKKARALWISLHQLGAIDDPRESALESFAKRQLRVDRLQWADQSQGFRLLEALKDIAARHGWDQRTPSKTRGRDTVRLLKDRLIGAQLAKLEAAGVAAPFPVPADRDDWSVADLERAAIELAPFVQQAGRD